MTLSGTALKYADVTDNETIHVTDTPIVMGATMVTDNTETIHVTDTPVVMGAAMVLDNSEVIHVTDAPSVIGLTPQQATNFTINDVNALYAQGVINSGQDDSLLKELNQAITMMNKGKINGATGSLGSFISEVQDLECSGVLSSAQVQPLIIAADNVVEQLGGAPPGPAACP